MNRATFKNLYRVHRAMKNKRPSEYSSVMDSVIALMGLPYAERYLETVTRVGNNAKWQPTETRVQRHKRQLKQLQKKKNTV